METAKKEKRVHVYTNKRGYGGIADIVHTQITREISRIFSACLKESHKHKLLNLIVRMVGYLKYVLNEFLYKTNG